MSGSTVGVEDEPLDQLFSMGRWYLNSRAEMPQSILLCGREPAAKMAMELDVPVTPALGLSYSAVILT